jgi:hypothetical protein
MELAQEKFARLTEAQNILNKNQFAVFGASARELTDPNLITRL